MTVEEAQRTCSTTGFPHCRASQFVELCSVRVILQDAKVFLASLRLVVLGVGSIATSLSCCSCSYVPVSPGPSSSLVAPWLHRHAAGCSNTCRCGPVEVIDLAPRLCTCVFSAVCPRVWGTASWVLAHTSGRNGPFSI